MENQVHFIPESTALQHNTDTLLLKRSTDTTAPNRLYGRRLLLVRAAWLATLIISVIMFVIAIPTYFEQLRAMPLDSTPTLFTPARLYVEDIAALQEFGISTQAYASYMSLIWVLHGVFSIAIALFIFYRRSDDRAAILTSFTLLVFGAFTIQAPTAALPTMHPVWELPYNFFVGLDGGLLLIAFLLFPDGRFVPRWTRWIALIWGLWTQAQTFVPDSPLNQFNWPLPLLLPVVNLMFGCAVYAQIYRYRKVSTSNQRQQTKWVIFGYASAIVLRLVYSAIVTAFIPAASQPGLGHLLNTVIGQTLAVIAGIFLALAIGFSALRYRLWDIDLVINKSLVYGVLTVLLGIVFILSVVIFQVLFQTFTGRMFSPIALTVSAVVIGALFQPTRYRLQDIVDRKFYHLRVGLNDLKTSQMLTQPSGALTGAIIGAYELLEPLGRGGMGEVYKAKHPTLGRAVAIKLLPPNLASEDNFRRRFEREARTVATLKHPNIVNVFDFGMSGDTYYMVMEYLNGHDLGDYLHEHEQLTLEEALPLIHDIAAALDYAHAQNIVHRDIKPSNIMLEPVSSSRPDHASIRAILTDFGLARIIGGGSSLTGTGIMGTLDYVAPEQIVEARTVDHRADIYALGVMVYQMLTGQKPFQGGAAQIVFAHLQQPPPNACDYNTALPIHVGKAIQKALAKQPERRFQSAQDFADALTGGDG